MVSGCRHIFGEQCLKRWVESSNQSNDKCPTYRNPMYGRNGQVQDATQTPQSVSRIVGLTQRIRSLLPNRSTRARAASNHTASRIPPAPPRARQSGPPARQFAIGFAGQRPITSTRLGGDGTQNQIVRDAFVNMLMPHLNSNFDSRRQSGIRANHNDDDDDDDYSSSSSSCSSSSSSSSSSEDEWEERYGPGRSVHYRR
jgi:hypothetical protein